jgi:hypothetical protein
MINSKESERCRKHLLVDREVKRSCARNGISALTRRDSWVDQKVHKWGQGLSKLRKGPSFSLCDRVPTRSVGTRFFCQQPGLANKNPGCHEFCRKEANQLVRASH